jgi:hypothetical protein
MWENIIDWIDELKLVPVIVKVVPVNDIAVISEVGGTYLYPQSKESHTASIPATFTITWG